MRTLELIGVLPEARVRGSLPEDVTGLHYDSRAVEPGGVFVCLPGLHADGHRFAAQAAAKGASVVVGEREPDPPAPAPLVVVPDSREALSRMAAAFFGYPARRLKLVGVTGTNGKTTSTHFLTSIAERNGEVTGRIGTVGYDYAGLHFDAPHTTPEAPVVNRLLKDMLERRVSFAAMEVSSHALDQRRAFALDFAGVLFTNLTQDHMDYHPSFEAYYEAKRRLFRNAERGASEARPVAAVNIDDSSGRRLAREADGRVVTFGVDGEADYRGVIRSLDERGTRLDLKTPRGTLEVELKMVGPFNVWNAVGAAALMLELGYEQNHVTSGLLAVSGVPGRMERVDRGQPFLVLVDYAHTPDALERVLKAARASASGRLIVVFGCGGDRDRTKRPIMGRLATTWADMTYVTSDNPRSEVPEAIVAEIVAGARQGGRLFEAIVDRRRAIDAGIRSATAGDAVVIAGKGHEPYQILKHATIHFDDREEAAAALERCGYGGSSGESGLKGS